MPRSSRHKSSKHSSNDDKEHSDSEKYSSSRDKRSREEVEGRVSKDSSSGDKRKPDLKDENENYDTGNGENFEEYDSSKRRREKVEDGTADRWNGGGNHDRGEDARVADDGEVGKKSAGKVGRHRESSRKEARDGDAEREKKGGEGRHESVVDIEDHCLVKEDVQKTASVVENMLLSSRSENQLDDGIRKGRDGSGNRSKRHDNTRDVNDRSSKDDVDKDLWQKSEKLKDDTYKKKYRDDFDKESKHREDKQRDKHTAKNHVSSRFDDKRLKEEKDVDIQNRKSKIRDSDRDQDRTSSRDWDRDSIRDRDREPDRQHYRDREDDRKRGSDRSHDHYREHDQSRDRDYDQDSDRNRDRKRDRIDYDRSNIEDRSGKYKDSREKKRSPDACDDYSDAKATSIRAHQSDLEKKSSRIDRVDYDGKWIGSQAHSTRTDAFIPSSRLRNSPGFNSFISTDESSHLESKAMKYQDTVQEQALKTNYSRELTGSSGMLERGSKYRSMEKLNKTDDGHYSEPLNERSSSSKASPLGLVDRSPSSASNDHKHMNRTGVRRSLDVEETGRRSTSVDMREFSTIEERGTLNLPLEKPLVAESSQVGSSSFGSPAFRSEVDSPAFANSASRYWRNNDLNAGRMHGNAWKGVANWTPPMPNGFFPFQHVPPHGGFQLMVPHFPAPPLFVRPLEINHSGMPYQISDVERFSSSFRPLVWQNVMDGPGPGPCPGPGPGPGWDGSSGIFRDEPLIYRGAEWDQNGTMKNCAVWNGQNGDVKTGSASPSDKDDHGIHPDEDTILGEAVNEISHPQDSPHGVLLKSTDFISNAATSVKERSIPLPEPVSEAALSPKTSTQSSSLSSRLYLSKIEISADLTYPELYSQCMNLLEMETERCSIADDNSSHKFFKIGARAGLGSSKIIRSPSPFLPIKEFVFKKAMELYKKQMMNGREDVFITEETMDPKSPSIHKIEGEDPFKAADGETSEVINSTFESSKKEHEPIADLNETIQDVEDNGTQDEKLNLSSERIEFSSPADDMPIETPPNLSIKGDAAKMTSDDDSVKGTLSSNDFESLMPALNESDSVITSGRILDSPEKSTH